MVELNGIIWNIVLTCIDYWQPEVKGLGLELCSVNVWGSWVEQDRPEGGGTGGRIIWRASKVLQVTVQVKRQILSAVWRKALEVPTVQRERSSLSGTQVRALWKKLVEWRNYSALSMSEHKLTCGRCWEVNFHPSKPTKNKTYSKWNS